MITSDIQNLDEDTLDRVVHAHTRTVDALAGFDTMVRRAEPEFRPVAMRFQEAHRRHAEGLSALIEANGRSADEDGSFMSTVNRLVVSTRAFFDEIDADVMKQIRDGEEYVTEALREVEEGPAPTQLTERARAMRVELEELLATAPG